MLRIEEQIRKMAAVTSVVLLAAAEALAQENGASAARNGCHPAPEAVIVVAASARPPAPVRAMRMRPAPSAPRTTPWT